MGPCSDTLLVFFGSKAPEATPDARHYVAVEAATTAAAVEGAEHFLAASDEFEAGIRQVGQFFVDSAERFQQLTGGIKRAGGQWLFDSAVVARDTDDLWLVAHPACAAGSSGRYLIPPCLWRKEPFILQAAMVLEGVAFSTRPLLTAASPAGRSIFRVE